MIIIEAVLFGPFRRPVIIIFVWTELGARVCNQSLM